MVVGELTQGPFFDTSVPRSVLRWVGNKSSIARVLARHAPVRYERYLEPFAGSAALFGYLKPNRAILGDKNPLVISLYKHIQEHPHEVYRRYTRFVRLDDYYGTRKALNSGRLSPLNHAAAFLYLNRTCFNGVFRTNLSGEFNVPHGRRLGPALTREDVLRFNELLEGVELLNGDYYDLVAVARQGDFIYLDPPYFHQAKRFRGEYGSDSFKGVDLTGFAASCEELLDRKCYVMISYKHTAEAKFLFRGWNYRRVQATSRLNRTSARDNAFEALITNY